MFTRSPFPGMDPYIEPVWRPFHSDYVAQLKQQLQSQLPPDLYAATESDVFVVDGGRRGRTFTPDAAAFSPTELPPVGDRGLGGPAGTATLPIRARVQRRPALLPHVAIREPRRGNRLVTAVELFSPTNKNSARERAIYRDKRDAYLMAGVNVVEVDLLRGGEPMADLLTEDLPDESAIAYRACVRFASPTLGDRAEYYPSGLRNPLPRLAVPLRAGDGDVALDLQRAFEDVYVDDRYAIQLDYDAPLDPPLSSADAAWAVERVAAARGGGV